MAKEKHKIVFFTPELGRTGSEIALLNLLPFTKDLDVTVVAMYKGELYDSLPSHVTRKYLYKSRDTSLIDRGLRRLKKDLAVPALLKGLRDATWYINTMVMPDILEYAEENMVPSIVHVHELEQMYSFLSPGQLKRLVEYPSLIIANSTTSAEVLKGHGRKEKLEVVYPSIQTSKIVYDEGIAADYRSQLNIAPSVFTWMMCGTLDNNKNPALFFEVAKKLKAAGANCKLVWIGGSEERTADWRSATEKEGMSDMVIWTGDAGDEFRKYFMIGDGLLLTSQRESFSMVTAEAQLLGIPVVANNCGGVSEVLGKNSDAIISERNNASQMAEKMIQQMKQPRRRSPQPEMKRFDTGEIGKKWIDLLIHGLPG